MSALRFCMITTFYPPHSFGGDGVAVQALARGLVARGHQVSVIYDADAYLALGGTTPALAPRAEPAQPDGVTVHALRSRAGALSLLLTQQIGRPVVNGRVIARLVEQGRYDVVHFHNVSLVGGPGVLSAGRAAGAVTLYTAHEHWLVCPTHVLWRHNREPCDKRECVRCQLAYHRPPQLWRHGGLLGRALHSVDAFIAMSEFSRAKHHEFGFPREMTVIPGFLPDEDMGTAAEPASPWPRPYFLFAGRLERMKGLDDVIPMFAQYPDADLVIAGDGTHRAGLERIAAGNTRVHFLGRLAPPVLARYYRHAIALLVPSTGFETFGLVAIEAFRARTPVIARRIGPLPELIEQSGGGLLFDEASELPALLGAVQHDAARRAALAGAARAAFEARWSEAAVLDRYLELVASVARAKERAPVPRAPTPRKAS
ncbi:MAG: glycosyltransferase family 4 protein [Gemmatimonadaceae bacterium]